MGVLTKMRNQGALLIVIIGIGMIAFLAGDVITSGSSFFFADANQVGEIEGKAISYQEFNVLLQKNIDDYKARANQSTIDQQVNNVLVDQTWDQLVREVVLKEQIKNLGIKVSGDELFNMVQGPNPHPQVRQAFSDPNTGVFDPQVVANFLRNMDQDPTGQGKAQWLTFERQLQEQRLEEKYYNMIKGGVYIPDFVAKEDYASKNKTVDIEFVMMRYSDVGDDEITIEESDLKAYYNKNASKYKQTRSRGIEYVAFDATPSAADSNEIVSFMEEIKGEFKTTTEDSVFVNRNSDARFFSRYNSPGELPEALDSAVFKLKKGDIYGPVFAAPNYLMTKVIDVKMMPDSAQARHILLPIQNNEEAVMAKADSLKKALKSGGNFAQLATQFSTDQGSAQNGGDLGWFTKGTMVRPFNDAVFNGKKGGMYIVKSRFGVHLIEVTDLTKPKKAVKLATIQRELVSSDETIEAGYKKSIAFLAEAQNDFDATVANQGLNKRLAPNIRPIDRSIIGLSNPREIIRWAYKAKVGDVSNVFELENKFVVAKLSSIKEDGNAPFDQVKTQIEAQVKKQKKAEVLKAKMAGATGTDLNAIASTLNVPVQQGANLSFGFSILTGVGREPKVVGSAFNMTEGSVSKPMAGEFGVFIVKVNKINTPTGTENLEIARPRLAGPIKQKVDFQVYDALKDRSEIKDNRVNFF